LRAGAGRRGRGAEIRLVVVGEAVSRVVELTGVNRVIAIYASLEDALTWEGNRCWRG
jgi:anti-anti-sigma regulatory factor